MQRTRGVLTCGVATTIAALAIAIHAVPILPGIQAMPGELRSLAHMDEVSIQVEKLPDDLRRTDLTRKKLEDITTDQLRAAGIRVRKGIYPRLTLRCFAAAKSDDTIVFFIDVHQKVELLRLKQRMVVPTSTVAKFAQIGPDERADIAEQLCQLAVEDFLAFRKMADSSARDAD